MSDPSRYGRKYWCVKVAETISPDGEVYLFADQVEVGSMGTLLLIGGYRTLDDLPVNPSPIVAFAHGQWRAYYESRRDGEPLPVVRWEGVVAALENDGE